MSQETYSLANTQAKRQKEEAIQKTRIEYADYTWNPLTGCYGPGGTREEPRYCSYCYAKRIAERFRGIKAFPDGFEPTFHPDRLDEPLKAKAGSRIFVGSMSDIGADWVPTEHFRAIMSVVWLREDVTFIFLTKQPQNLARHNPWPSNAWVGITIDGTPNTSWRDFANVKASLLFVSFEPLLGTVAEQLHLLRNLGIGLVIIGAQTQPLHLPEKYWVTTIEKAADAAGIPVFEKNNLAGLFPDRPLRQEVPA